MAGADAQCATQRSSLTFPDSSCSNVRAFVSISAADQLQDMPASYAMPVDQPVLSITDTVLAPTWGDLFVVDGGGDYLSASLNAAGVSNRTDAFWLNDGAPSGYDCNRNEILLCVCF